MHFLNKEKRIDGNTLTWVYHLIFINIILNRKFTHKKLCKKKYLVDYIHLKLVLQSCLIYRKHCCCTKERTWPSHLWKQKGRDFWSTACHKSFTVDSMATNVQGIMVGYSTLVKWGNDRNCVPYPVLSSVCNILMCLAHGSCIQSWFHSATHIQSSHHHQCPPEIG